MNIQSKSVRFCLIQFQAFSWVHWLYNAESNNFIYVYLINMSTTVSSAQKYIFTISYLIQANKFTSPKTNLHIFSLSLIRIFKIFLTWARNIPTQCLSFHLIFATLFICCNASLIKLFLKQQQQLCSRAGRLSAMLSRLENNHIYTRTYSTFIHIQDRVLPQLAALPN